MTNMCLCVFMPGTIKYSGNYRMDKKEYDRVL